MVHSFFGLVVNFNSLCFGDKYVQLQSSETRYNYWDCVRFISFVNIVQINNVNIRIMIHFYIKQVNSTFENDCNLP